MEMTSDQGGNRYGNRSEQVPTPHGNSWGCIGGNSPLSQADGPLATLGYNRPSWQLDALCREYPKLPWHPERGQSVDPALQVCGRCAVRPECLAWAMADPTLLGVLGGTSYKTRRQRRNLDAQRPT